ncbi:hypothetical protein IC620_02675 [Hazenella sp. IB182357]|uniref:Uncharacterized protein n=1 Tax=Polycladospora coralii TaxID=2771432 RepID=A0A926N7R7_9BACL|nr:hypothetical protein [Polycladospora coralii]MBD1371257.1 hypothetical protein [Polycladospora coralii]
MKWHLSNMIGNQFVFMTEANSMELTIYARNMDQAVEKVKGLLREGAKVEISSDWFE